MAFSASKKEWCELYSFFRLLSEGSVCMGTAQGTADEERRVPVTYIQREEHDGTRQYFIEKEEIHIVGEKMDQRFPREDFGTVADLIWGAMNSSSEEEIESPDGVEEFLDAVAIFNLEAQTDDRTDYYVAFWNERAPLVGFRVHSHFSGMNILLDGGRAANMKFEQVGTKFPGPVINKINLLETPNEVVDRMLMIERMGGQLKYSDVADKVFRSNLSMIDLHFPRLLAEMVRTMHLEEVTRIDELTERMKVLNPLKIKEELIQKHRYYEYKVKQFLMAVALGMRPAKLFNGTDSAVGGFMVVGRDGRVLMFSKNDREEFADYLYHNTRLEKGSVEKDKYGFLERENGVYYFKLNVKVGLLKRK
jgi:type II restriction enzyme